MLSELGIERLNVVERPVVKVWSVVVAELRRCREFREYADC